MRLQRPENPALRDKLLSDFVFKDLGLIDYSRALAYQLETVEKKQRNQNMPDTVFLLEHPGVFTLGKNGGQQHLCVSESFLASQKIDLVSTGRGGDITYHGPGQLVCYPIVNLEKRKIGVNDFVTNLEEIMISTLNEFSIKARRNPENRGVWVNDDKIGSIGLGIKKQITFHGMALNVDMDLTPFSWINPCGLTDTRMTSIKTTHTHLPVPSVEAVKNTIKRYFQTVFNKNET